MFLHKKKSRYRRALTDMTASYPPLRKLNVIKEEIFITFITDNKTEFMAIIFLENDANNELQVNMWIQGYTDIHFVKFYRNDCMWYRDNEVDVLFWKHPIYTSDISMCLRFHSRIDADNFMNQVNKSYIICI